MATTEVARKPRRRWRQFGLRTLGLLILLVAVGMALWRTLLAEHFLVKWIERQKGTATTEPALPDWLAWLPGSERCVHVTQVNLNGCRIGDDDLWRFEKLPKLRELHLMNSDVTLPAVEAMVNAKPDLDCDLAFGERLYHAAWSMYREGNMPIQGVVQSLEVAARYKSAIAQFQSDAGRFRVRAADQHLRWLEQVRDHPVVRRVPPPVERLQFEKVFLRCAELRVRLQLAILRQDHEQVRTLAEQAPALTDQVLATVDLQHHSEWIRSLERALFLSYVASLRALAATDATNDQRALLECEAVNWAELDESVNFLHFFWREGGESDAWGLVNLLRLQNDERLSPHRPQPRSSPPRSREIPFWADYVRRAVDAALETGTVTTGEWLACHALSRDAELEYYDRRRDHAARDAALQRYRANMDDRLKRFNLGMWVNENSREFIRWEMALRLCVAMTAHVEDEGRPFFEHGFRAYLKKQLP